MVTLGIVVVVATAAAIAAWVVNRRKPDVPTAPRFATPQQLDRRDFDAADVPWLFALFSSDTCLSCLDAREVLSRLDLDDVHVAELSVETHKELHARYAIDAVPTVVLADTDGVVRWSYLGAPPPDELGEALRDIGILPPDPGGTAVSL